MASPSMPSPVPQSTLKWLWRVLTTTAHGPGQVYVDPKRVYSDVANLLSQYVGFSVRTDVYTYENGSFALLLCLSGTLPVSFRGAIYHFPVTLWFPLNYPHEAPIAYVTPPPRPQNNASVMTVIRPGQHVSVEGRIYHPLLAGWSEGSSIAELLVKLQDVFAKEPPVVSKPVSQQPPPVQVRDEPPPIPPLPPDLNRREERQQSPVVEIPQPPPRPPKQLSEPSTSRVESPSSRQETPIQQQQRSGPPPLPPLPSGFKTAQSIGVSGPSPQTSAVPVPPPQNIPGPPTELQRSPYPASSIPHPNTHPYPSPHPQPQLQQPHPIRPPTSAPFQSQPPAMPPPTKPAPKQPPPDLLSDPFDMDPISSQGTSTIAPPPIPPNPQKDALLRTLSETLTKQTQSTAAQNSSGLELLSSQAEAMRTANQALLDEMARVTQLRGAILANLEILKEGLNKADEVIRDTTGNGANGVASSQPRPLPSIDETLVPPTVVQKQLHDLVISERSIQRVILALQEALTKGRVGVDVWAKVTRGLAREAFLKRALALKAAQGAGLDTI